MKITHTANAGIIIEAQEGTIAFDALHSTETPPFSAVPDSVLVDIAKNININALVFTHLHTDHFSESWTRYYKHHHKDAKIIAPPHDIADITLTGDKGKIDLGFTELEYARIIHDGEKYADVANYGFCFSLEGKKLLLLGDGSLDAPELPGFCAGKDPDIAFVNFPFVSLTRGRERIEKNIKPSCVIIYHLPFRKKDRFHFYESVLKRASVPGMPPVKAIFTDCMQTIEI